MSSFDSDNDFIHEDYYETNGNFYSANGVYQGKLRKNFASENGGNSIENSSKKLFLFNAAKNQTKIKNFFMGIQY